MSNLKFLANLVTVHVDPESTRGWFSLLEMQAPPGDEPPLHVHLDEDEGFHVVEGEVMIWIGEEEPVVLGPGQSAVAPQGIPHTYRVTSEDGARWFVSSTPARFGRMVAAYAEPTDAVTLDQIEASPPDLDRLGALAAENGIQLLGPPGMKPSELAAVAA